MAQLHRTRAAWIRFLTLELLAVSLATGSSAQSLAARENAVYAPALYQGLEYRLIGPHRGGRVTAVAGVSSQPRTFYMGSTGGGVWKTTDGGESWKNTSDRYFRVGSIGAIAVADSDPNVVYVGTGSACIRGNVSPGAGVYKSTDAGRTWQHLGLDEAGQIGRIRVHPKDPDLVYLAAMGHAFGPNPERGVFRSKDGGKTWDKVLYTSEKTGAVDIALDVTNPRFLYAATWTGERKPWTIISGSAESGVYKTTNGGDTWTKLTEGLPSGLVGRIGVAVSPANPNRVWAVVEAEEGGLYGSDDGGSTFRRINKDRKLYERAWYYGHVYAHPRDEDTVYVLTTRLYRSIDGGITFDVVAVPHGDNHDLWIHPNDPDILAESNDGGANISYNGGRSWSTQYNQPTAEIYRVTVDEQFPYRVYGAQQDNSTISVPSIVTSGITVTEHWYAVGGGESGHIAVNPRDPDIVYAGSYGGTITRLDRTTGQLRDITAFPWLGIGQAAKDMKYRFQWNAPIRISPHDPGVLYQTSNYVHRSTNEGQSWSVISPDLTRNDRSKQDYAGGPISRDNTSVETYGTIFAFEESRHRPGLLWAGSDDGLVHVSRDGGATWENITPRGMPEWGTVNMIEPSAHDPGRAFMAAHRYRLDDFRPYIFGTNDYGKSWRLVTDGRNGIPPNHFVRVVREDPDRKGLLYAGTEFGMYVSFDDGTHWQSLQLNLPITPISDLAIHRKSLVVATQGRSFWILDDLALLHQLSEEVARSRAHLFKPGDAYRMEMAGRLTAQSGRAAENPPNGASIYYYFAEQPQAEVRLEILDSRGTVIRTFSTGGRPTGEGGGRLPAKAGLNRLVWDLRYPRADIIEGVILRDGPPQGPKALPGTCRVKLSGADWSQSREFDVLKDPRLQTTQAELEEQFALLLEIHGKISETYKAIRKIRDLRDQARNRGERMFEAGYGVEAQQAAASIGEKLTAIEEELIQTKFQSEKDPINFPPKLDNLFVYLSGVVDSADTRPTDGARQVFEDLKAKLAIQQARLREVIEADVAGFNTLVLKKGVPAIISSKE